MATEVGELKLIDTTDVDRWVGRETGGGQLKDPIAPNDIRRWAQGMQNPNPLYYDEKFAEASEFRRFVAPQSFAICTDVGHGATPAIQGNIPGSHMLFGGDEWWFEDARIAPGDLLRSRRKAHDYKLANTSFAGQTMFQRGDTTYINQNEQVVVRQRSTSIRYLVENARKLNSFAGQENEPEWSDEDLDRFEQEKLAYYKTFQHHVRRTFRDVDDGETLPVGVIGPHSIRSFTTEWRAYIFTVWGSTYQDEGVTSTMNAGWLPEMSRNEEQAQIDPAMGDGLYRGPSRGHAEDRYARVIGVPRAYGYGASMGAWVLDYLGNWTGELGRIVHSNTQYRHPPFSGDVTYLHGRVAEKQADQEKGVGIVAIDVQMVTQTGATMARGTAEVQLPLE